MHSAFVLQQHTEIYKFNSTLIQKMKYRNDIDSRETPTCRTTMKNIRLSMTRMRFLIRRDHVASIQTLNTISSNSNTFPLKKSVTNKFSQWC